MLQGTKVYGWNLKTTTLLEITGTQLLPHWHTKKIKYRGTNSGHNHRHRVTIPDATFTQTSDNYRRNSNGNGAQKYSITGHDGKIHTNVRCYNCNKFGNYASNFPNENQE